MRHKAKKASLFMNQQKSLIIIIRVIDVFITVLDVSERFTVTCSFVVKTTVVKEINAIIMDIAVMKLSTTTAEFN